MTITAEIREQVRQRANFACEFCGVTETDVGGELTVDHFQPTAKGGGDDLDNLLYCCARCNQYKLDYWPTRPDGPSFFQIGSDTSRLAAIRFSQKLLIPRRLRRGSSLWNPRREPASQHLLELDDGTLHPLTATGAFMLQRLRLDRPPLVAHRLRERQQAEEIRLLTRYRDLIQLLEQMNIQLSALMEEQRQLFEEQRELLRLLLGGGE